MPPTVSARAFWGLASASIVAAAALWSIRVTDGELPGHVTLPLGQASAATQDRTSSGDPGPSRATRPMAAGSITVPAPGSAVSSCTSFSGTARLDREQVLLVSHHEVSHQDTDQADPSSVRRASVVTPRGASASASSGALVMWQATQDFGTGTSTGTTVEVTLVAVDTSSLPAGAGSPTDYAGLLARGRTLATARYHGVENPTARPCPTPPPGAAAQPTRSSTNGLST